MKDKSIYIIFSKTGTYFSNVISFFTRKEYSHVSISLDESFRTMYSFGRKVPELMLPAGFVEENLYDGVFANFPEARCSIYRVPVSEDQYEIILKEIEKFTLNKDIYSYNILGAVTSLFKKPLSRNNKYFCSQFVGEVLIKSGVYTGNKQPEVIKPMDLFSEINDKELLYEGLITASSYAQLYAPERDTYNNGANYTTLVYMYGKVKSLILSSL